MANKLPKDVAEQLRIKIYARADDFGYANRSRTENSHFMDDLLDDPEIGGVLKIYYQRERIRTYIKDAMLNAYMKARNLALLDEQDISAVLQSVFCVESEEIQKLGGDTTLYKAKSGEFIVVSRGTYIKWETALRKALIAIGKSQLLLMNKNSTKICLLLAVKNGEATEADKNFIRNALSVVGVGVYFC